MNDNHNIAPAIAEPEQIKLEPLTADEQAVYLERVYGDLKDEYPFEVLRKKAPSDTSPEGLVYLKITQPGEDGSLQVEVLGKEAPSDTFPEGLVYLKITQPGEDGSLQELIDVLDPHPLPIERLEDGLVRHGDSLEAARRNLVETKKSYLSLLEHAHNIPGASNS